MKNTIIKTALCLAMFVLLTNSASAFVFSDVAALAQRATQFVQTARHYVNSIEQLNSFIGYVREFNDYRRQFESYQRMLESVHRKIDSGYYTRNFNVSNWNWTRLDDHILRAWRSVDRAFLDAQMLTIRSSRLYETNPAYRRYADRVMQRAEERVQAQEREARLIEDLENRLMQSREDLQKLLETNQEIAGMDNSASHQAALTNQILLVQARMQAETALLEQRKVRENQEMEALALEFERLMVEAQQNDSQNIDFIFNTTRPE